MTSARTQAPPPSGRDVRVAEFGASPALLAGVVAVFLAAAFLSGYGSATGSLVLPLSIAGALLAGVVTLLSPAWALVILVFSMLLSPEITVADAGKRPLAIRVDDVVLVTVFFIWMVRSVVRKGMSFFASTPLNRPMFVYTLAIVASTASAAIAGKVSVLGSSLYALKYVEYFLLYILVVNVVERRSQMKIYLAAGAVTAAVVCAYAYSLIGKAVRLYAPFDASAIGTGESATLGGYLLIVIFSGLAFVTQGRDRRAAWAGGLLALLAVPPLLLTLSRASIVALAVCFPLIFLLRGRRKVALFAVTAAALLTLFYQGDDLVDKVKHRLMSTFGGPFAVETAGLALETSAAQRVTSWKRALTVWIPEKPLIGHGVTGVGLVDAQLPLVAGETGLVGLTAFLWLIGAALRLGWRVWRRAKEDLDRSLGFALMTVTLALSVQSLTTNTFIIVRIMEPFWFLAALAAKSAALPPESS